MFKNFNLTNLLNTITLALTTVAGLMQTVLGCSQTVADSLSATCSSTVLPAKWMLIAAVVFAVINLVQKFIRPGGPMRSLFGQTAVVVPADSSHAGVGTVTPEQVKSS